MGWRDKPFVVNLIDCAEFAAYTSVFLTITLTPTILIVLCFGGVLFAASCAQ
jgi:hypothetical protein